MISDIPKSAKPAIRWLAGLAEEQLAAMVEALGATGPSASVEQLATEVAQRTSLPLGEVGPAFAELAKLYALRLREFVDLDEFVSDYLRALQKFEVLSEDEIKDHFANFLSDVLKQETSLGVAARAMSIVASGTHLFCHARVITDLRPVFPANAKEGPKAAVIAHSLEITYHEAANWQRGTMCISLDKENLIRLREATDRALAKADALSSVAKTAGLPLLEMDD